MADYIASVEGRFDNQVSAGADAAANSMNRAADAADKATVSFERTGKSASQLNRKYDSVTKANAALAAAMRDQADAAAALQRSQSTGVGDAEALERTLAKVTGRVNELRGAQRAAIVAAADGPAALHGFGAAMEEAAGHGDRLARVNHSITREFIVMGHEAFTGRFSRIPGSFMVLAEHADGLLPTLGAIGGRLATVGAVGVAATAAVAATLGLMAYHAAEADARIVRLQNTLMATRGDWQAASQEVMGGAFQFSAQTGVSRPDARAAAQAIVAVPEFSGSTQQLENYLAVAHDLSRAMGITLPAAAERLALSLSDPTAAAKKATQEGLRGFTVALDENVRHMQASGDLAQAQAEVLDAYKASVGGAAEHVTELGAASHELGKAWAELMGPVEKLTHAIGHGLVSALAEAVHLTASAVQGAAAVEHVALTPSTPAGASGFVGSAEPLPGSTRKLMPTIRSVAGEMGLDPSLLARLQAFENPHQNADGSWPTSPTGAVGPFQVLPSTFRLMRADPRDYPLTAETDGNLSNPTTNATVAGELMKHLLDKYHDPYTAILAYHDGETVVDAVLNNGNGAGNAYVSPAARNEADLATAGYQGTGFALRSTYENSTHAEMVAGNAAPGLSLAGQQNAVMAGAQAAYDKMNTLGKQIESNKELQSSLEKGIQLAGIEGDTATVAKYSEALAQARGAASNLISEQDKLARSAKESTAGLDQQSPVLRELAAVQQKFSDAARGAGQPVNEADVMAAQAAALQKLTDKHNQAVAAVELDTAAQRQLAEAYQAASGTVQHVQDLVKATNEARQTAIPGSAAETRQIEESTAALDANAAARADVQTAQDNQKAQQTIAMLNAEIAAVGQSTQAWHREEAALKERQAILDRGGDPSSAISQQAIKSAQDVQALTAELQQQQAAMAQVGQIGDRVFGDLGKAITSAFVSGQGHAVTFKSIVQGVLSDVESQLVKLAVINPLENLTGNGHSTTLASLIDGLTGRGATGSQSWDANTESTGWQTMGSVGDLGTGATDATGLFASGGLLGGLGLGGVSGVLGSAASILGPIGLVAGVGSLLGGLFGHKQHNGWDIQLGTANGQLGVTSSGFEGTSKNQSAQDLAQAQADAAQVNGLLAEYHASVSGSTLYGGGNGAPGQAGSFEQAMGNLVYTSTDAVIAKALQSYEAAGQLSSISNLAQVLAAASSLSKSLTGLGSPITSSGASSFGTGGNYVPSLTGSIYQNESSLWANTYAPQLNEAQVIGASPAIVNGLVSGFNQVVSRLYQQAAYQTGQTSYGYTAATQTANGQTFAAQDTQFQASAAQQRQALQQELDGLYGTAYESTQAYADMFGQLNTQLAAQQQALAEQQAQQQASDLATVNENWLTFYARQTTAQGGNPEAAALANFDAQAEAEKLSLQTSLLAMLKNGVIDTSTYYGQITDLDKTLAAERLAIQQQYVDQANAQITSQVSSLKSYLQGLEGDIGTPADQLRNTRSTFASDLSATQGGNTVAFSNLQADASAFLSASKSANGVGTTAYMRDMEYVIQAIGSVTSGSSSLSMLTASTMSQIAETQTQKLQDSLSQIRAEIAKLNVQTQQASMAV